MPVAGTHRFVEHVGGIFAAALDAFAALVGPSAEGEPATHRVDLAGDDPALLLANWYVARELVRRMCRRIRVDLRPAGGAGFVVELPLYRPRCLAEPDKFKRKTRSPNASRTSPADTL